MLWESEEGNLGEISNNENWVNPYKGITLPLTQNLKTLGLWVFFLYVAQLSHFYQMWDLDSDLNT